MLAVFVTPDADAHTPHDVVVDIELSPEFEADRTAYAIVRSYLLKTEDGGDTWRRLVHGLDHDSPLSSLGVAAGDKRVVYVGTRGDGIYRSRDGGLSWTRVVNDLPGVNVASLTVSPHSPDEVVAAIGGDGGPAVYHTDDGGQSWSHLAEAGRSRVIAFAPDDPGVLFSGDGSGRVRMSSDAGVTWRIVLSDVGPGAISDIAVSPTFASDRTAYVATHEKGIYKTTDGGESFASLDTGDTGTRVTSILLSQRFDEDSSMWVSTWRDGVFTSTDGGDTWDEHGEGLTTNEQADLLDDPHFGELRSSAASLGSDATVFLAGFDGLFRATGTDDWESLETQVPSNIAAVALSPDYGNDQSLAVATYINGALLSTDGGRSWHAINDGLASEFEWTRSRDYVARMTGIWFSPSFTEDRTLFAGIRGYVLRSENEGGLWTAQSPDGLLAPDEVPADFTLMAFSPRFASDRTVVLGTDGGKVFRSTDGGVRFEIVANIHEEITAIVVSPDFDTDRTVVVGTPAGVYRSTDVGTTWEKAGELGVGVTSLAVSPGFDHDGRMFVGTHAGLFVTGDGASTWTEVNDPALGASGVIEAVVLSPSFTSDGTAFVSVKGRGLFRSLDGGVTFHPVGSSLLDDNIVLSSFYHPTSEPIVFSPDYENDKTLFGMADATLLKSTDGGETWESIELPVTVHDTSRDAAPARLLKTAVFGGAERVHRDDRGFDTPIGRLSVRRVLAAAGAAFVAFVAMFLVRNRPLWGRRPLRSGLVRLVCAAGVLVAALLAVAA